MSAMRWLRRALGIVSPSEVMTTVAGASIPGLMAGLRRAEVSDFRDRSRAWLSGGNEWLNQRRFNRLIAFGESPQFEQVRRASRLAYGVR
jgi:hypothetical protein